MDTKAKSIGFLILVGLWVIGWSLQKVDDLRASWAGFPTTEDWKAALSAGYSDNTSWSAKKAADKAEQEYKDALAARLADIEKARCREDVVCWGNSNKYVAGEYCKEQIQRVAKYEFEWQNSWLDSPFSRATWIDKDKGTVLFVGDKLRLRNGFGVWENYIYDCAFDTMTNTVIDIGVKPGRL